MSQEQQIHDEALRTKLKERYTPKQDVNALQRAIQLDKRVSSRTICATGLFALTGLTIFATGITCCLSWHMTLLAPGLTIGIMGAILCCMTPYMYRMIQTAERKKVGPEILTLLEKSEQSVEEGGTP